MNQVTNGNSSVIPFEKDVMAMTPDAVLDYLAFIRRQLKKRAAEREAVDQSTLPPESIAVLTEVALSDTSELLKLDRLEAQIYAELDRDSH